MDNPEKLATQGTQDEEKQNKDKTQYVLDKVALFPVSDIYFIVLVTIYN